MPPVTKDTLLRYCQNVYDALAEDAKPTPEYDLLWSGKIIETYAGLGISNAHYGRIMDTLYEIGAIQQVRRGARGVPTLIALHSRPENLDGVRGFAAQDLTKPTAADMLSQRVDVLERRLEGIELKKALASINDRLSQLESKASNKKERSK